MKLKIFLALLFCIALLACKKAPLPIIKEDIGGEDDFDGNKRASITYQLLIYSFADSNGDGIGDFNGIKNKLDYLDCLGVSSIWLSPIHPAMSYHGYDVTDYYKLNPEYGTEEDFKSLISEARKKGISIYLDYVLNHSGKDHPWFKAAASSGSEYRKYYSVSSNPKRDISNGDMPMIATEGISGYNSQEWFMLNGGNAGSNGRFHFLLDWSNSSSPTITVTKTTAPAQESNPDASIQKYIYYGQDKLARLYFKGGNTYEITLDFSSEWGFLLRTSSTVWDGGTKYGAIKGGYIRFGEALPLTNYNPENITFSQPEYYHSHFQTDWFADFNYGPSFEAHKSPAFKDLAASAEKWIKMGVEGLRLDAVKHIYHNAGNDENPEFLKQWYERCNSTYKDMGHNDDIFMVGEILDEADKAAPYYKGLPSVFEFSYWWRLKYVLNNNLGSYFVSDILSYRKLYERYRPEKAIASIKLSNHDENRTGTDLGRSEAKMKQAAAFLLTSEGKPFIYQGEELGYYGAKDGGDEFVRGPMKWTESAKMAVAKLSGKVDMEMLGNPISVESQNKQPSSILNVYKRFARMRNSYPALASGKMSEHGKYNKDNSFTTISCWYMTSSDGQRALVVHNVGDNEMKLPFDDDLSKKIGELGAVSISGKTLSLGAKSSAVFLLR